MAQHTFFFSKLRALCREFFCFYLTVYGSCCAVCFCVCAEPAPPKSLYAVNATHTAVTLLWTEEGVVDFYQIFCKPLGLNKELKVRTRQEGREESTCTECCVRTLFSESFRFHKRTCGPQKA